MIEDCKIKFAIFYDDKGRKCTAVEITCIRNAGDNKPLVYKGLASCSLKDAYCRAEGQLIAFKDAMRLCYNRGDRSFMWDTFSLHSKAIQKLLNKKVKDEDDKNTA